MVSTLANPYTAETPFDRTCRILLLCRNGAKIPGNDDTTWHLSGKSISIPFYSAFDRGYNGFVKILVQLIQDWSVTYLNPVIGRIKISEISFALPPSFNPVRAFHRKSNRSWSQVIVENVTAAGPVSFTGSILAISFFALSVTLAPAEAALISALLICALTLLKNFSRASCSGEEASAHCVSWIGYS